MLTVTCLRQLINGEVHGSWVITNAAWHKEITFILFPCQVLDAPHAPSVLVALNHEICLCRLLGLRCQHFLLSIIFCSNKDLVTATAQYFK